MRLAELLALGLGWLACSLLAARMPAPIAHWAMLTAALAGSTLVMHLPTVTAATQHLSASDVHLIAVVVAVPCALPAALLRMWGWSRRRGEGRSLVGRQAQRTEAPRPAEARGRALVTSGQPTTH